MNLTPEQAAVVAEMIPSDGMATGLITIVPWIDASGQSRWSFFYDDENFTATLVGLLELMKQEVLDADRRLHGEAQ